ncbi:MAG: ABC transporter substrate-binding protein, partial [Spirochaetota bacterium]
MRKTILVLCMALLAVGMIWAEGQAEAGDGAEPIATEFPRSETLYTSGTMWGPPNSWNPLINSNQATGTRGLVYESLFLYDPLADEYIPWLATDGEWINDTQYELTIRDGVTWSDGEAFTVEDVVFSFEVHDMYPTHQSDLWAYLDSVEAVDDSTVRFTFGETLYHQWDNTLFMLFMIPEHIFSEYSEQEAVGGSNANPVGTGPYLYETHQEDRQVWRKNQNWWAIDALGLEPEPRYIIDIRNSSNNVALGQVLQGQLDLSNNFLPGIATLIDQGYPIGTYYSEEPYMLSANTAWLVPNLTREPLDDVDFRHALASSINVGQIVEVAYANIVQAANPTGLLPTYDQYIDWNLVEEIGFSYDPDEARQILADAGYEDTNDDGFVETPDGDEIELSVIVPFGWSDWMEAARIIAAGARDVGINLQAEFPDAPSVDDARTTGDFDLVVNNWSALSDTPWTYYEFLFS